jgi:hypothetical protein
LRCWEIFQAEAEAEVEVEGEVENSPQRTQKKAAGSS